MDERSVPRPRPVKLDELGLSSTDAFVLAQIDGTASLDEVADATALPLEAVLSIARRLEKLGAIEQPGARGRPTTLGRYSDCAGAPPDPGALLQIPRRTGLDVHALRLETGDAFLLSNVDGAFSVGDLAEILGDGPAEVLRRVTALVRAGALELFGPRAKRGAPRGPSSHPRLPRVEGAAKAPARGMSTPPAPAKRASSAPQGLRKNPLPGAPSAPQKVRSLRPSARSSASRAVSIAPTRDGRLSTGSRRAEHGAVPRHLLLEDAEGPADATNSRAEPAADEGCDLDAEARAAIDARASAFEGRSHYAALGVPRTAAPKEVQKAYFALAAALHPDRHFGKRLGAYKKKLEHAFRVVSDAYEVLRVPARRAEYDAYLKLTRQSAQLEAALAPASPPPPPPPPPAAPASAEPSPPRASREAWVPEPMPMPPSAQKIAVAPATSATPGEPSSAARLEPARVAVAPEAPRPSANLRPTEARRSEGQGKSAALLDGAQRALVQGDATAAANLYRLALHYAEDPAARGYAESGLKEARALLADTQLMKARYEEKEGRWSDAVASYAKALDGKPDDPAICERLANALHHEGHDLLRATRLAELAVSRAPRRAAYRRTLGRIYADAGLRDKAIEALGRAIELDPTDEEAARVLAMLEKRRR